MNRQDSRRRRRRCGPRARALLVKAEGKLKAALVMHFRQVDLKRALAMLKENDEFLRPAIAPSEEPA